jgi:hypothetical protein
VLIRRSEIEAEWGAYGDTEGAIEVEYGAYAEDSAILPGEVNRGNLKVIGEWLPPNPPFQPTALRARSGLFDMFSRRARGS